MIDLKSKTDCCGCTACESICPRKCIVMTPDEEGFLYPEVDQDQCIQCGLCDKVCPVIHMPSLYEIKAAYITRNRDRKVVLKSSSGGAFSAISMETMRHNGIVIGAVFDNQFRVRHVAASTWDECVPFRGSKYVQSDLNGIFPHIKELLEEGKSVCFSGCPCQNAGLRNYLKKDYENLLLVEFVCHGVPSSKLWDEYLSLMAQRFSSKVSFVNFRSKRNGYQSSVMNLKFKNGKDYYASPRTDIMLKSFYSNICSREICYRCPFKGLERPADLTVFDCWHAASILSIQDDDLGYTSVLANTKKGVDFMGHLTDDLEIYPKPIEEVIPINGGMLIHSAKRNKNRGDYYQCIAEDGLQSAFDRYLPVSMKDHLIERLKPVLQRVGILHRIARIKKLMKKKLKYN